MADRNANVIIGYKTKGSDEVIRATKQIEASIDDAGDSLQSTFRGSTVDALNKRLTDTKKLLQDSLQESNDLRDSLGEAGDAAQSIKPTSGGGSTGGATETVFQQLGSLTSNIPGASDLANVAKGFKDIQEAAQKIPAAAVESGLSLGQFVGALGVGAIAVGAIALAMQRFGEVTAEARHQLDGALAAQESYYEDLANLTTAEAEAKAATLARTLAIQEQEAAEAKAAAESGFNQLVEHFGDAAARAIYAADPGFQSLQARADSTSQSVIATTNEITRLNQGIDANAFAANDAAAAQNELAAAQEKAAQAAQHAAQINLQTANQAVNREAHYADLQATATEEQVQSQIEGNNRRVEAIQHELEVQQTLSNAGQDTSQTVSDLNHQLTDLQTENQRLGGTILESARAHDAAAQAIKDADEAEKKRTQTLQQIAQIQAQISADARAQALQDQRSQRDLARTRLREDIDFQRQQAANEQAFHQTQLDEIKQEQADEAKAKSDILKTQADFNTKELERVKKYQDAVADIENKSRVALGEAAGELDAKAAYAALQQKAQELDDAKQTNDEEKTANEQARDQRIAELQQSINDEQKALQAKLQQEQQAFAQSQAANVAAFNERRARENEDLAIRRQDELQDRAARRAAQIAQLTELQQSINQEKNLRKAGQTQMLSDIQSFVNAAKNATKNLASNVGGTSKPSLGKGNPPSSVTPIGNGSGGSGGGFNKGGVKGYALGGRPPVGQVVRVGERGTEFARFDSPATVYPHGANLGQTVQINAPITVYAQDTRDMETKLEPAVQRVLGRVLARNK